MTAPMKSSSHMARNVGIGVVVLLILVAGAYAALSSARISVVQVKTVTETTITSSTTQTSTQVSSSVVNGDISVGAGQYEDYQFTVPDGASNAQLAGNFIASGGSGNDILVLVLDQTDFVNWQNGHSVTTYYNSGQLTTSSISASLPSGVYYLIYSNTFSTFSSKTVNTDATLTYTQDVQTVVTYTTTYTTTTT
jgi:hypothetical protein